MKKITLLFLILLFANCKGPKAPENLTEKTNEEFLILKNSILTDTIYQLQMRFELPDEIERIKDSLLIEDPQKAFNYISNKRSEYIGLFASAIVEKKGIKMNNSLSKTQFESVLSNWDGSLPSLVKFTKENLNDPKSFEHVETGYAIKGDYVKVRMIYRAKNGFNALVKGSITAKVDGSGNLLEIIDSQ